MTPIYTNLGTAETQSIRELLEALSDELDRPLRVLAGSGRTWAQPDWTQQQADACDVTLEDANQRGLTYVQYATLHPVVFDTGADERRRFRDEFWDGVAAETARWTAYDLIQPWEHTLADPYELGGMIVGEITHRTVLTYFNWLEYTNPDFSGHISFDLFVTEPLRASLDDEAMNTLAERLEARRREKFIDYAKRASSQGITNLRDEIDAHAGNMEELSLRLTNAKHTIRDKQRLLDAMLAAQEEDGEAKLLESLEKLDNDPRIERISFSKDRVLLDTIHLDITHPTDGRVAPLGKFRWTIPMDGNEDVGIIVENLTNQRGGFDHPHVNANRPCFGEMGRTIYTMVRQGDLAGAVEMLFMFLESINLHDDWSRRATFWFDDTNEERAQLHGEVVEREAVPA